MDDFKVVAAPAGVACSVKGCRNGAKYSVFWGEVEGSRWVNKQKFLCEEHAKDYLVPEPKRRFFIYDANGDQVEITGILKAIRDWASVAPDTAGHLAAVVAELDKLLGRGA